MAAVNTVHTTVRAYAASDADTGDAAMVSQTARRAAIAVVAAAVTLVVASWLDAATMRGLESLHVTPDSIFAGPWFASLVFLVPAAGVLVVGLLAWWADSLLTSSLFVGAGAGLALVGVLDWELVMKGVVQGTPPVLSGTAGDLVHRLSAWSSGAIAAVQIIGAGMVLAALIPVARRIARRFGLRIRSVPASIAIAAALLAVYAVAWPDGRLYWTGRDPAANLNIEASLWRSVYDLTLAATGVMAVGFVGWWGRSSIVGAIFLMAGTMLVFSGVMATQLSGVPMVAQLGGAIDNFLLLNADHAWRTVGGGLLLVGATILGAPLASRRPARPARLSQPTVHA